MNTITAIIVEDEKSGMENLVRKLERSCPNVKIIAQCRTGEEAIKAIHQLAPQLIFLDIELGSMSGFDVLERLQHIHFEVIFTTSFGHYAIQAIKANALDYIKKPITDKELIAAVNKARQRIEQENASLQRVTRIAVPESNGIKFIEVDNIKYCKANDNFTFIHLNQGDQKRLLITRTLGEIERKLPNQQFYRIHRSNLVNRHYIDSFSRKDGGCVVVKGESTPLLVSRNRKEAFLGWLMEN